jgi:hypothetical protein
MLMPLVLEAKSQSLVYVNQKVFLQGGDKPEAYRSFKKNFSI